MEEKKNEEDEEMEMDVDVAMQPSSQALPPLQPNLSQPNLRESITSLKNESGSLAQFESTPEQSTLHHKSDLITHYIVN